MQKDALDGQSKGFQVMLVNERIAAARKSKGISTTELSGRVGISQTTMSRYEKGIIKLIPETIIRKIADALDFSYNDLIGDDPRYGNGVPPHTPYSRLGDIEVEKQKEDEALLNQYHLLPPEWQDIIKRICAMSQNQV